MRSRRGLRIAVALAVLVAAVAAVILLNLALLGYTEPRNDPVGKLSPLTALTPPQARPSRTVPMTPQTTPNAEDRDD